MCNCKKKPRRETIVITQPQVIRLPQTPDELHTEELNQWNGGEIKIEEDKQEN